jgi:hypothetical protein
MAIYHAVPTRTGCYFTRKPPLMVAGNRADGYD